MKMLYNEKLNRTDTYSYEINEGGIDNIRVSNGSTRTVSITFIDGKFIKVVHNIGEGFMQKPSYYAVMGGIYEQIKKLECKYKEDNR